MSVFPRFPVWFMLIAVLLVISCASGGAGRQGAESILGDWMTDKGILMRVHRLADGQVGAEIVSAPGFFTTDTGAGSVVLRNIRPYSSGYSGDFVMPGNLQPVRVTMRFINPGALLFETRDKRAGGNKMIWKRAPVPKTAPKP